jgi:hypothetical protein
MPGIEDCLDQAMSIPGALSVTLVDYASGLPVASAGGDELNADEDAAGTADLVRAVLASPALSAAQTGDEIQDIIVAGTTGHHVLALAGTATDGDLFLHLLLDAERGDLTEARGRLRAVLQALGAG